MITLMKKIGDSFELSATDLVGYLNCHNLAALDRRWPKGSHGFASASQLASFGRIPADQNRSVVAGLGCPSLRFGQSYAEMARNRSWRDRSAA
ncbi:hypothetical protein [Verrucomicrobium sp. 3C]|uniref:hypothetical protein n=1 Tax=Verrucomicrobium sp. 3C TaxID=1134055 RepID=UPI0003625194|nr:hypothetical protein [Verrucomicrobium sp. 3C]